MQTKPRFYLPELDGLRFIAFLLVYIHNAPYTQSNRTWEIIREQSWIGIDLFFCLSGYLITRILADEFSTTGNINLKNFYIRRGLRILPLYFLTLSLSAGYTIFNRGLTSSVAIRLFGLVTLTDDFLTALQGFTILSFAFHLWTISYEMQFYTVIPFLLRKCLPLSYKNQFLLLGLIYVLGNIFRAVFIYYDISATAIYVLPITHFDSLLGGIALGLYKSNVKPTNWTALFGTALLLFWSILPDKDVTGWHLMLVYPAVGIGFTLIIYSVINSKNVLRQLMLGNTWVIFLGRISYGLYTYHILCIYLIIAGTLVLQISLYSEFYVVVVFAASLALTILLSAISYRYIETPFLNLKMKFAAISQIL